MSTLASNASSTRAVPPAGVVGGRVSGRRLLADRVATVAVHAAFVLALVPLVWILWTVVNKGLSLVLQSPW